MSGNDSESSSCPLTSYDSGSYLVVAGVRLATGLTAFLCCLSLVVFFIYIKLKLQMVTNQILVFYLTISSLLHSGSSLISRVNFQTGRPVTDNYCLFAGPLALYTGSTEWMCILCISCNLLVQVTCRPEGKKLYWVYGVLIFVLPLLWCWLPFLSHAYGTSGPWCGVRIFTEDCEQFLLGVVLRLSLLALPVLILLMVTSSVSLATWTLQKHRLRARETAAYPQSPSIDKRQVLGELQVLLWFPPLYSVLQLPLLVNLLYDSIRPDSPLLPMWCLQAFTPPLAAAVTALLITIHSETNTVPRIRSWLAEHCQYREKRGRVRASSSNRHISEYNCDLCVSYGDSLEGVQSKHRRERIRRASQGQLSPITVNPHITSHDNNK